MRSSNRANAELLGTIDPGAWITRLADVVEQWVMNNLHEPDQADHEERHGGMNEKQPVIDGGEIHRPNV